MLKARLENVAMHVLVLAAERRGGGEHTVDLASLEELDGDARLVFWEAKHFDNPELRAEDNKSAPVTQQIKIYQNYLRDHSAEVLDGYKRVAKNFVEVGAMRPERKLSSLIADVGTGKRRLTLDKEPKVGLVIFGFDIGERDHPIWKDHLGKLRKDICDIQAKGDATKIRI